VATGYRPSDPACRPHYGYGRLPHVIAGYELEEMLRNGKGPGGPGGEPPRRIGFIQCVGSRDQESVRLCLLRHTLRLAGS
jgi:heterodisulfide reductase subunit A